MTGRSRSGTGGGAPGAVAPSRSGAVLRDVHVHTEPRAVGRPGAGRAGRERREPGLAADATPARSPSYEDGVRDGLAQAEATHRAALEAGLEVARAEGMERGLAEGREAGRAEALEAARQQAQRDRQAAQEAIADRTSQLDAVVRALESERIARHTGAIDDLVALSHAVICRILGEQLVTAEGVARCVRQAIREQAGTAGLDGGPQGGLAIHLHPIDLDRLQRDEHVAASLRRPGPTGGSRLQWVADERVGPGGCVVRSAEGSLDARLETQLVALRRLLTQVRPSTPSAPACPAAGAQGDEERR